MINVLEPSNRVLYVQNTLGFDFKFLRKAIVTDRNLLLNQLHAHAACDDPAVREQMRACFARLVELVERESGADAEQVRMFFAHGMLLNVLATMGAADVDAHWAQVLLGPKAVDCC